MKEFRALSGISDIAPAVFGITPKCEVDLALRSRNTIMYIKQWNNLNVDLNFTSVLISNNLTLDIN